MATSSSFQSHSSTRHFDSQAPQRSSPSSILTGSTLRMKKRRKAPMESKGKDAKKVKEEKEPGQEPPTGYIHVRARRGQATDSHSLAERVRREKISERMKLLQSLVPGCHKVTGKASMLDEIINYVQSLQNQVEVLSMKLASMNPMVYDFGTEIESFMVRPDQDLNSFPSLEQCFPPMENDFTAFAPLHQTLATQSFHHQGSKQGMWEDVEEQRHRMAMSNTGGDCIFF